MRIFHFEERSSECDKPAILSILLAYLANEITRIKIIFQIVDGEIIRTSSVDESRSIVWGLCLCSLCLAWLCGEDSPATSECRMRNEEWAKVEKVENAANNVAAVDLLFSSWNSATFYLQHDTNCCVPAHLMSGNFDDHQRHTRKPHKPQKAENK